MKFGKILSLAAESSPELNNLFLRYKELKKALKNIQDENTPAATVVAAKQEQQQVSSGAAAGTQEQAIPSACAGAAASVPCSDPVCQEHCTLHQQPHGSQQHQQQVPHVQGPNQQRQSQLQPIQVTAAAATACLDPAQRAMPPPPPPHLHHQPHHQPQMSRAAHYQAEFLRMLNEDLIKFNQYFIEKEEEAVIRLQLLADEVARYTGTTPAAAGGATAAGMNNGSSAPQRGRQLSDYQVAALKSRLVDLHGELVLLLHWSVLQQAAVIKIAKKHDKVTGVALKSAVQGAILNQPFSSTAIMQQLVKSAEELIARLTAAMPPHLRQAANGDAGATASGSISDGPIFKRTKVALDTWATLGSTASTPSTVLPASLMEDLQHSLELLAARRSAAAAAAGPGGTATSSAATLSCSAGGSDAASGAAEVAARAIAGGKGAAAAPAPRAPAAAAAGAAEGAPLGRPGGSVSRFASVSCSVSSRSVSEVSKSISVHSQPQHEVVGAVEAEMVGVVEAEAEVSLGAAVEARADAGLASEYKHQQQEKLHGSCQQQPTCHAHVGATSEMDLMLLQAPFAFERASLSSPGAAGGATVTTGLATCCFEDASTAAVADTVAEALAAAAAAAEGAAAPGGSSDAQGEGHQQHQQQQELPPLEGDCEVGLKRKAVKGMTLDDCAFERPAKQPSPPKAMQQRPAAATC